MAQYVAKNLPDVLKSTESYKKGELKQSMVDCFLEIDQLIISDKVCVKNILHTVLISNNNSGFC